MTPAVIREIVVYHKQVAARGKRAGKRAEDGLSIFRRGVDVGHVDEVEDFTVGLILPYISHNPLHGKAVRFGTSPARSIATAEKSTAVTEQPRLARHRASEPSPVRSWPYDALLFRERQAGCLLAAEDTVGGLAVLTEVFQRLSALGARGDAVRVTHLLHQHGVEVKRPWWGERRGYGDQLSPRELNVVRLLADGSTNRQIAKMLFLSPKTVARHVDMAMRKMGVISRTILAVKAVQAGLVTAPPPDGTAQYRVD